MTNKDKFFVGFLILLIVIQLGVIGSLLYSKYSNLILKEKEQTKQEDSIKEEKDVYSKLLETINSSNDVKVKMEFVKADEDGEPFFEKKDIDKNTLSEVIAKLKENTGIEELPDGIGLEFPPYSYIVTYKIDEKENTFKILVSNEENKAWVYIDNQFKLYSFKDSLKDFMKNIYEK